jgi:O-antigen ligase
LRPEEIKYSIILTAAALGLVVLGALQPRMFVPSLGVACLAYLVVATTFTVLWREQYFGLADLAYVPLAFAMYTLVRRSDEAERGLVIALLLIFGTVQSLLAVTQSIAGWPVFAEVLPELHQSERNYFSVLVPGITRLVTQGSGTFSHFNSLGALLSACLPLALGVWLARRRSVWRLTALVVTAAGLIATFSRGALLGAVVGMVFVLWFGASQSRRATIALSVAIVVLVGLFGANVLAQYYESTQNASIRVKTWNTALGDALDRPADLVLGSGFRYFGTTVLATGLGGEALTQRSGFINSLHSSHLQLLLEFGLVGFALGAGWVAATVRGALARGRRLAIPAVGGAVGVLASQVVDNALFSFVGVVFVVLMAIAEEESDLRHREGDGLADAGHASLRP